MKLPVQLLDKASRRSCLMTLPTRGTTLQRGSTPTDVAHFATGSNPPLVSHVAVDQRAFHHSETEPMGVETSLFENIRHGKDLSTALEMTKW